MIINNELNYEEENKKLKLFLQKQAERIKKLRERCGCPETGANKETEAEKK